MTWWLRSRRAGLLAATATVQLGLVLLIGGEQLPLPSVLEGSVVDVPAAVFLPLLINCVLQLALDGPDRRLEQTATRATKNLDVLLIAAVCGTFAIGAVGARLLGATLALQAARNTLGYVGMGALAGWLAGARAGAIVPAGYVFLIAAAGSGRGGLSALISWPIQDWDAPGSAVIACALAALGLAAAFAGGRRIPRT